MPSSDAKDVNLTIALEQPEKRLALFGAADRYLRLLRESFGVQITSRNDEVRLTGEGEQVNRAAAVLNQMQHKLRRKEWLSDTDVSEAMRAAAGAHERKDGELDVFVRGHAITGRTPGQKRYLQQMLENDLTFCTGPAGTGKTYLAVAVAVHLLKRHAVKRIILARPAVEAGEKLGFLPGDLAAKVNPYLRPLFDSLNDMIDMDQVRQLTSRDVIEIIPLAFMRGRTFNESCIILDEAQNTTIPQMMMCLTRLGEGSKMIVTGDASQIDLPDGTESGLVDALHRLHGIRHIGFTALDKADIVRHKLVQHIVDAYGEVDARTHGKRAKSDRGAKTTNEMTNDQAPMTK
ncbi:MAG: PhoH family protein [Tepidisphaeraceae bacterium]